MTGRPRVYIDSCVLLNAVRGKEGEPTTILALDAIGDESVEYVYSRIVELEALPDSARNKKYANQQTILKEFFADAQLIPCEDAAQKTAIQEACTGNGLSTGDALHVGCAITAGAAYILTAESPTAQLMQCKAIPMKTIYVPPIVGET